jgi:putative membrane protein
MTGFILRAVIAALGLWLATRWVGGLSVDTSMTLLLAALLLGIVNAIVRPLAIILTFPLTLVTLGLFLLVINAGMVALVAAILPGMKIATFWAAFFTALIVSVVSWIGNAIVGPRGRLQIITRK